MDSVVVTGAGGFIGGHLVRRLRDEGVGGIRAVDAKPLDEWHQVFPDVENVQANLELLDDCRRAVEGADTVFNLAADMGGMGFIENNKALCMLSVLVSTHILVAARDAGAERLFYASSACVYAAEKQSTPEVEPLREADAYPAMPEDGYGWEKLFSERMARHFQEDFGIETRVARYHNVYGPNGTWDGGREKAPAAICRKVAAAKLSGDKRIELVGMSLLAEEVDAPGAVRPRDVSLRDRFTRRRRARRRFHDAPWHRPDARVHAGGHPGDGEDARSPRTTRGRRDNDPGERLPSSPPARR